jgi:hypothetical protein
MEQNKDMIRLEREAVIKTMKSKTIAKLACLIRDGGAISSCLVIRRQT